MSSAAPSGAPSSKEKKYDRQLRLWGAQGQNRLEAAHIALVNASATGCEILKNLILPSIGKFTVIDDKLVEEADLGSNFFLDDDSLGQSRAERACALLGELNPDVTGNYISASLLDLLASRPELFNSATTPFTHLILTSPIATSTFLQLPPELPIFLVHSIGFTACLRVAAPTHTIVETHPDSLIDLRLLNPWKELSDFAREKTQKLDIPESEGGMSDHAHGHVPYVLLLLKYLEDWKASHDGNPPSTYQDKNAFKAAVLDKMRTNVPGGSEENYEEAIGAVLKNIRAAEVSSETMAVFNDPRCAEPTTESENFWIIAHAVNYFRCNAEQGNGFLPLSGGFPDMKAESQDYVHLQNIYRARAKRDATIVHENVKAILTKLGHDSERIPFEEVETFAKHANFIRRIDYRPLAPEYSTSPDEHHKKAVIAAMNNWDAEDSLIHDYVAIRAWQMFYTEIGKPPGETDADLEGDLKKVTDYANEYLNTLGHTDGLADRGEKMCKELVRAGGGELHVLAALTGGIVAQEIVKIITKQYIPINNTVLFDGIKSTTSVFAL